MIHLAPTLYPTGFLRLRRSTDAATCLRLVIRWSVSSSPSAASVAHTCRMRLSSPGLHARHHRSPSTAFTPTWERSKRFHNAVETPALTLQNKPSPFSGTRFFVSSRPFLPLPQCVVV